MPKYEVEIAFTCQKSYSTTMEVSAKDEDEAESKALAKAEATGPQKDWEENEDDGEYECLGIEEIDSDG